MDAGCQPQGSRRDGGGIATHPIIVEAACIGEANMDPIMWLTSTDQTLVLAMSAVMLATGRMRKEAAEAK